MDIYKVGYKNNCICSKCNGIMRYRDQVLRMYKTKGGTKQYLYLERYSCKQCGEIHRVIPDTLIRYKHYEYEIIRGVIDGYITSDVLGYEDYPCEKTMLYWRDTLT